MDTRFNQTFQEFRSRLSALENEFSRLGRDHSGAAIVLKGDPGSVEDATAAAAKLMHEERTAHEAKLSEAIVQLKRNQEEFINETRNTIEQFQVAANAWLRQLVKENIRQLLIEANILNPDGTQHSSLKGEKGDPSTVPGPRGEKGESSIVPGPPGRDGKDGVGHTGAQGERGEPGQAYFITESGDKEKAIEATVAEAVRRIFIRVPDFQRPGLVPSLEQRVTALENKVS